MHRLWRLVAAATLASLTPVSVWAEGERLAGADGAPMFLISLNYEGPADRAWQMWENDKFDARLIDADFGRAAAAGAKALRVFVQPSLAADIGAGKWDKLDQVVGIAERHGVQVIVSLHDYAERDISAVAATAGRVAERYRGRAGILAFDLKNEPRFNDLAQARYPKPAALQQRSLVERYGERVPRAEGQAEAEWLYANNLQVYRDMLAEASAWVREQAFRKSTLDYLDDPAGEKWKPLLEVLNGTLRDWLAPQVDAIRRADPTRLVTVDHVDAILAKLPANDVLDVQTVHRYPGTGGSAVRGALALMRSLQAAHPNKPYLLGEFGYATETLDPERVALHETALMVGLLAQKAAGGTKWMLNDMPPGFNQRERTLGAFRLDGSAKPVVAALAALRKYLDASGSAPGDFIVDDDADVGLRYVYRASDALLMGGKSVNAGAVKMEAAGPAQAFISWTEPGLLKVWASAPLKLSIDPRQLPGAATSNPMTVDAHAGDQEFRLAQAPPRAADYDVPNGHFFSQTNGRQGSAAGYSVTNEGSMPFWDAFLTLGGVEVLGYPVTRRFVLDGFTVQAFQKVVLQWQGDHFAFLNTFDVLHDRGRDDWLSTYRQTPRPLDTTPDAGLAWDKVVARHLAMLDGVPAPLKQRFVSDPQWLDHYGLPVATQDYPNSVVVRAQRATFQYWKEDVPWAPKGTVSVANGGDLAKEAGLFPWLAVTPDNAPR